jgi:hypothetical protein
MNAGVIVLGATETVAKNVTVVTPSDKTGRDILIAAIVTVVGSIGVAFIAAATAGKRQERSLRSAEVQHNKSLRAQIAQHTESLAAEDRRLVQRLQHERRQQDVQHLRGFLDEMAAEYERAYAASRDFAASMKAKGANAAVWQAREREASFEAVLNAEIALHRLALRFDENHDVYKAYMRLVELTEERRKLLAQVTGGITPEQDQESATLGGQARHCFAAFGAAARAEIAIAVAAAKPE